MHPQYPIPSHYHLVYPQEQVDARVRELGKTVGSWCAEILQETQKQVLAICVMRGGTFFYADLVRAFPCSVEMGFCQVISYSRETNAHSLSKPKLVAEALKPQGRNLLFIDEICDSGKTLAHLKEECLQLGASDVKTAVLVYRQRPDSLFTPDYIGFEYPEKFWLVGYGMDDADRNANIPGVYYIEGTSIEPK